MRQDDYLIFEAYKSRKLLKEFDVSKDWPARDNEGKPRARTADEIKKDFNDAFARRSVTPKSSSGSVVLGGEFIDSKAHALVKDFIEKYGAEKAAEIIQRAAKKFGGENEEQMLLFPDPKPTPAKPAPVKRSAPIDYRASMADVECIDHPERCVP